MAYNSAEQLRIFMADSPRANSESYLGDGTASAFTVSAFPFVTGSTALGGFQPSAFVRNANGDAWTATGGTSYDVNFGLIAFANPIPFGEPFQVRYAYGTFSDANIDFITATYPGDINQMRLRVVDWLMADSYKRARWGAGGVHFDDAQTLTNLVKMRDQIWREITLEQGPLGGIESWGASQENWP